MIPGVSQNLVSLSIALMLFWGAFALFALWKVNGRRTRNAFALLLLLGAFLHGSFVFSKGDGPQNAPRRRTATPTPMSDFSPAQKQARFVLSGCSTNAAFDLAMPANAVVHQPWLVRGAASDGFFLSSTNAFFRLGTNEVRFARIDSSGMIGFSPRRRDAEPVEMPDSGGDAFLAPLRTSLGIVPGPNGARAGVAESCVWHAETADGLLVTWQEALADRVPSNAVTFQVELRRSGDFVYRYDIPAGTVVSNFVIGAQNEGGGETALIGDGGLGCTEGHRCATVWDGATEHPLCERLAPDGILRGPLHFELRWTSIADLDPENPDCDDDGLSNRDEVCRYHTDPGLADSDLDGIPDGTEVADDSDPLDPDEDGDGIPDGVSPAVWSSNPLWGEVTGKTNLVLIAETIHVGSGNTASLRLNASLTVPLAPGTNTLHLAIPSGEAVPFRIACSGEAMVRLSAYPPDETEEPISTPSPPTAAPYSSNANTGFWVQDPCDAFLAYQTKATGFMTFPTLELVDLDGHPAYENRCLHSGESGLEAEVILAPTECGFSVDNLVLDGLQRRSNGHLFLPVGATPGESATGSAAIDPQHLAFGELQAYAVAHRCGGIGTGCCDCPNPDPRPVEIVIGEPVGTDDNRYVCRYSTNPPGRPTLNCKVRLSQPSASPLPITLTGNKTRFMPGVSETNAVVLPANGNWVEFEISGEHASETMNDAVIEAHANTSDGILCGNAHLTVVWVDQFSIRNSGVLSQDNNLDANWLGRQLGPCCVKAESLALDMVETYANIVEIQAVVHPGNLVVGVDFARDNTDEIFAVSDNESGWVVENRRVGCPRGETGKGNDRILSAWTDSSPFPNGFIYDVDTPGIPADYVLKRQNVSYFLLRMNFLQYTAFRDIRCSDDFPWFVRMLVQKSFVSGTQTFRFHSRNNHPDDNQVGSGTTTLYDD